jgi:hypothetical protein
MGTRTAAATSDAAIVAARLCRPDDIRFQGMMCLPADAANRLRARIGHGPVAYYMSDTKAGSSNKSHVDHRCALTAAKHARIEDRESSAFSQRKQENDLRLVHSCLRLVHE